MLPGKGGSIIQAVKSWCELVLPGRLRILLCFIVIAVLSIAADPCSRGAKDKGKAVDDPAAPAPERPRLEEFVRRLAAPEMEGRRGEGGRKAAALLIEEFRRLKLEPLFAGAYVQEIPAPEQNHIRGRNVGAVLRGHDPGLRGEWIIVSAHFDHLGKRGAVIYPGADDNASGVAMMLEVARSTAMAPQRPRRSLMFVGFDLEELGLFGSRYFVAHPPVPLEQIALFITADMIGRALAGVCRDQVFVLGTEHAPGLRPWLTEAALDQPLKLGMLGSDVLILNRSDYGPFRTRRVPYLFFSTGENPRYHSPEDKPETLDYSKLTAITRVINRVVATAADAPAVPRWTDAPDHPLVEAITLRDVISTLLQNQKTLELGSASTFVMKSTLKSLEEMIARGAITQAERANVIQAARLVLLMIH
jgi:hypothetical protein